MTILHIYVAPHPVLKKIAAPVETVTDETRQLMKDMLETMYATNGIGLAAPQVGVSERIIVMDLEQQPGEDGETPVPGKPLYFINPEIIWESEELNIYNEGCLSVPDQYAEVERPKQVRLKYLDFDGQAQEIEADEMLSTCIQHEIDHLNGILFIDHLSSLKRDMLLRKVKKWYRDIDDDIKEAYVIS